MTYYFLRESGFKVTKQQIEKLAAPFVLRRDLETGRATEVRKKLKRGIVKVRAWNEVEARKAAQARLPVGAVITSAKIVEKGRRGWLGIVASQPHLFQVRYKLVR